MRQMFVMINDTLWMDLYFFRFLSEIETCVVERRPRLSVDFLVYSAQILSNLKIRNKRVCWEKPTNLSRRVSLEVENEKEMPACISGLWGLFQYLLLSTFLRGTGVLEIPAHTCHLSSNARTGMNAIFGIVSQGCPGLGSLGLGWSPFGVC